MVATNSDATSAPKAAKTATRDAATRVATCCGATAVTATGDRPSLPRGTSSQKAAAGLLASGSPPDVAFPSPKAQWRDDVTLPGHSGEDHTGISPVSRALRLVARYSRRRASTRRARKTNAPGAAHSDDRSRRSGSPAGGSD